MKTLLACCARVITPLSLLLLTACVSTDGPPDVTVAGDLSDGGQKFRPPTVRNPYYYYLVSIGPRSLGPSIAGEEPPPPVEEVEPFIVETLAKQHYILANSETPFPSLVIGYAWGTINVEIEYDPFSGEPYQVNEGPMLALVSTRHTDTRRGSIDMSLSVPDLEDSRHFLLVGAYNISDFPKKNTNADGDSNKKKKRKKLKPLWRMKLSTPSRDISMADATPVLLENGGEFFGQDQLYPETLSEKLKEGKVTIGELIIIPDEKDTAQSRAGENKPASGQQAPAEE